MSRLKIKTLLFILAAIFNAQNLLAQDSLYNALPKVWNLSECILYAKENNYTVNSLKLSSKSAEQDLIAAKAAKYPNLTGSVTQDATHYKSGTQSSSGYGVNSGLTLFNGGYLNNDIKSKNFSQQIANLSIVSAENDMTIQLTQAYLNILLTRDNITYLKDLLSTSQAQVNQAQQEFKIGTIAKNALLQLQATMANDNYTLITAQNQLQQNILTLKQLLQLPTRIPFEVATTDTVKITKPLMDLNSAQDQALQTRPEVKSELLNVQLQTNEMEKAKASIRPLLSLGGSISSGYNSNSFGSYPNQLNSSFNQGLGLTLAIPIFDRKVTRTNVAKANIEILQAKLSLLNTKTILTQAVETAYLNVQNANSQYAAAKEQLNYTSEALRIAEAQLKLGVNNMVEYLQQKNLYIQALQAYIQAKYTANLNTKIYDFYTGVPITE
ncbi:outer membrane protein [Pedobacter sp. ok626]|uniref:TolC family protein n=1 Tax=Pedobacter sp. ok626 TaxID=1761882 RepID=UPI00087E93AF|nr:TolC family protein [Pedobacter sp. ok626]SDJ70445.1 outer membrane protein [Pedobacter sp. ok626]